MCFDFPRLQASSVCFMQYVYDFVCVSLSVCAFPEVLYFFKIRRCSKSNKVKACTQTAAEVGNFRETEIPADFLNFSPFFLFFSANGSAAVPSGGGERGAAAGARRGCALGRGTYVSAYYCRFYVWGSMRNVCYHLIPNSGFGIWSFMYIWGGAGVACVLCVAPCQQHPILVHTLRMR